MAPGDRLSEADAARLGQLREAIRAPASANHAGHPDAAATDTIRAAALTVAIDDTGGTLLEPTCRGVDGAVATLLGILHEAQLSGDWSRLKGCRQCGHAFFDRSEHRSAAWCAMSICGNRTKNRAYYRRRRTSTP